MTGGIMQKLLHVGHFCMILWRKHLGVLIIYAYLCLFMQGAAGTSRLCCTLSLTGTMAIAAAAAAAAVMTAGTEIIEHMASCQKQQHQNKQTDYISSHKADLLTIKLRILTNCPPDIPAGTQPTPAQTCTQPQKSSISSCQLPS